MVLVVKVSPELAKPLLNLWGAYHGLEHCEHHKNACHVACVGRLTLCYNTGRVSRGPLTVVDQPFDCCMSSLRVSHNAEHHHHHHHLEQYRRWFQTRMQPAPHSQCQ